VRYTRVLMRGCTPRVDAVAPAWACAAGWAQADRAAVEAALAAACGDARAAWPSIALEDACFVAYLARRVDEPADAAAAVAAIEAVSAADLWLACACVEGCPGAAEAFEQLLRPHGRASLRRLRAPDDRIDDVLQIVLERALVGTEGRGPRIADFSGRGSLRAWLRATVTRAYLNEVRADRPDRHADAEVLDGLSSGGPGVDVGYLKRRYRDALSAAFVEAMECLADDVRVVLRYFYIDGINLDQLGVLLGVSRATAHRRLVKARAALAAATTERLRGRIPAADRELDSIRRLVQSQIDVTQLSRLMRGGGSDP